MQGRRGERGVSDAALLLSGAGGSVFFSLPLSSSFLCFYCDEDCLPPELAVAGDDGSAGFSLQIQLIFFSFINFGFLILYKICFASLIFMDLFFLQNE